MNLTPIDTQDRWWNLNGADIDLNAESGTYPPNIRACILAHRDGVTEDDLNMAAYLEYLVDTGDTVPYLIVNQWLFDRAQERVTALWERIARYEKKAADERAA